MTEDTNEIDQPTAQQALPPEEARPDEFCSKKVYDELYDRFIRLQADFDNFRKRVEREKRDYQAYATEKLITDLLPVLDHLELALKHSRESEAAPAISEGVDMVLRQFMSVLEKYGLQAIEAVGRPFDPQYHEALMRLESEEHVENTVTEEHQRGYTLGGRTLRPSRVTVSRQAGREDKAPA